MSEENIEITDCVVEIRDSWVKMADEYRRNELHSDEEFHSFYKDVADAYVKGVESCHKFFEHNNIEVFVKEIIELGFFYQAMRLSKFVKSDDILKTISEIKEEFGFSDDEMEEKLVC